MCMSVSHFSSSLFSSHGQRLVGNGKRKMKACLTATKLLLLNKMCKLSDFVNLYNFIILLTLPRYHKKCCNGFQNSGEVILTVY